MTPLSGGRLAPPDRVWRPLAAVTVQAALLDVSRYAETSKYIRYMSRVNATLKKHCKWMWDTFVKHILSHLGFILVRPPTRLPRIWWVCCDVFSTFPIHAPGDYNSGLKTNTFNYCVSWYTTTVKSLRFSRNAKRHPPGNGSAAEAPLKDERILAISMSICQCQ
jgi:hypothetical protein